MKEKIKVAVDIDVVTINVWKEKKDVRRNEVSNFFKFVEKNREKFQLIVSKHTLNQIEVWKNKPLVGKIKEFYEKIAEVKDPSNEIKKFEKVRNVRIEEFAEKFAKEVKIKLEDSLTILLYSLLGIEYFVTYNKKHLRNKYGSIKTAAWKYGIKVPEIMLPFEFTSFFSQLFKQKSSSTPSNLSSYDNRVCRTKSFSYFFKFSLHNPFLNLEIFKFLILSFVLISLTLPIIEARSFIVYNVSNPSQTYFIVNGTTGYVGIGLSNPLYPLHIVGDVYWSGTLQGGIVPWGRLSGYNLNVPWSGYLGWGNLTGYNLNVNWQGKLGWGNLTNYPSIITSVGSGLNAGIRSLANDIILEVNFTETQRRVVGACSGSKAIQVINADGSVVCVDINLYGNVTGTGTPGYIPIWQTSSSLADSLINQTAGNVWITSGNLNIVSGALQIGGINVISSARNIVNVNDVNATRIFQGNNQVIDTLIAGTGISITGTGSSRTISNIGVLSLTAGNGISLNASTGNILISNTGILGINVNAPLTSSDGQTPTLGFNYNTTAFSLVNNALTLSDAYFTGSAYDSRFVNEGQANSITTEMIVDGAITTSKIADRNVTLAKLNQTSCPAGKALRVIGGGTYECIDVNPTGTLTGSGSVGYIPLWNGTYSLNNSVIYQSGGSVVIGSGNLNIQSGGLQIGGTNVINSGRNLTGVNWVNQDLRFEIVRSSNSNGIVWSGLSDLYKIYVNETAGGETTNLIIEYADNADQDNVIFRMVPYDRSPKHILSLRYTDIIANATFRPLINNLIDLGTSSYQWANIYGVKIYQNNNQVIDTITANAPLSASKTGGSVTISLTTPLALTYGGTGRDMSIDGNYIVVKSGNSLIASPVDLASANLTGVLPASKGGTGIAGAGGVANRVLITTDGSTWQAGLVNLANMVTGVLSISYGGTGASDASTARVNLQTSGIGSCPQGYAVMNLTTGGPQCIPVATPGTANVTGAGAAGQVAFWVGSSVISGSNNLYWDNTNARLGIGTTAPEAKLDVYGSTGTYIRVSGAMPAGDATEGLVGYELANPSAGGIWRIYLADPDGGFGVAPRSLEIWEYPANLGTGDCCRPRLRIISSDGLANPSEVVINSAGNVGIGTTSPAKKLDVDGEALIRNKLYFDANFNSQIYWDSANNRLVIQVA